ncbi:serine-rich adhesin for platelets-like isoform X9 [Ctenopharyngodon idella]|uniref:serine-rich adhesin for platelets-like isoform X9 n=1 Tax=Ctenopharyngodon idella TaxID=7959 RepID=UPI00222E6342|nr:serine-rich adhesin for platelets-like isoform X9 [Ctenopharyngodon idella]
MFGFWSIQGSFLFAMDQGWKRLPLLVVFLFLSSAYGFKGGAYSNAHQRWGQPSDNTFSPHAVQSSVSEVPVTGTLPEEVGSSLFTNRPLKRFNLLQFVKGHDSSHHESMSYAQTAPSSSVFASLPLPLSEKQAGSLTLLQGSGTTITDTASVSTQSTSGQSTSDQSFPSLYMSSSQETSGVESAEAALPVFSQESISYSSSSAPGATYTSQGSPVPLSEGSSQAISPQDESSYSRLFQSQGASSHYTPDSYTKLSSSSVSSQSTSDQSPPSLYSSSSQDSSGSLLEASGSFFQGEMVGLSSSDLSPESQTSGQLLPSSLEVSSQFTNGQGSPSLFIGSSKSSSDSQSTGPASLLDTQGSLSQSILSTQTQGSTSQGSAGPELSGSSGQFIPTQVEGGSYSVSQLFNSSPYAPGSLMYGKFGPLPIRVSSQSTSTQSSPGTPLTSSRFPVQGGSSSTSSLYLKPQGTLGLYAPASSTKYVSVPMPQRAVYSQATSGSGALFGTSIGLASQGMSSTYSGSVQPQGTTSQFAPGSPSFSSSQKQFTSSYGTQSRSSLPLTLQGSATYGGSLQAQGTTGQFAPGSPSPSVSLSSPQGAASQSATVLSSRKQFTSSYGTQSGSSLPLALQGSPTYGGSLQPQGTASQFVPGSPSSGVSLSSAQGAASQPATVPSSRKQFTSSYGTQTGSSLPLTLQGGAAYGGSLQPQGTTSQFAPGSPSSFQSVSLSSPQGAASQSAAVLSSRKQFTSSYGTQSGSSLPLALQGSPTYGGSLQPQGTASQFAPGSPSSYPSVSLSSPQGAASQSATVLSSRKQFTSSYGTQTGSSLPLALQGSPTYGGSLQPQGTASQLAPGSPSSYPSVSLSSPQGAASQSATVLSSRKQFTSSYGTQTGSSLPLTLQGGAAYGGSLQPQGTASQFAPGSPSPSVSLSSPQGAASQSATVLSSRKQFTSSYGTQTGSSLPLTLQGGAAYGGSLQPQGTTGQFAPGSPSPSVSLSSPQGAASQSATVLSSRKQFTSSYGTQSGSSLPLALQGSPTYGGSLQPQGTTSQFAPGSPSSFQSVSLSSPQGVASQPSQAFQSYSVSQSQKSQRWQPSQGIQTSGAAVSQGIDLSQSSPMQSRFSSLSSAGGPSSKDSGLYVSAQGGGTSYGGFSLNSQSPLKYNPGSHAYAKFGSSPLAVSSQSTSDQHSNGLYSSGSLQTQGLLGVVEGPSSQAPFDSPSSNQIERFVMLQRPTGSNLAPSLGLSAQASSVSMLSGVPQTAQALRESGSDVQLNNQVSSNSQANAYTSLQKFSSNYGAQSLKPSELLRYEPGVYGQGTSSASELLSSYGSTYNLNAPASIPSRSSLSSRYYSVKG